MKFNQLLGTWKRVPVGKRVLLITVVLVTALAGTMVYSRVTTPTYAVLYGNVSDAQASDVLAKLDAKGIAHKVEGNGTRILVPQDSLVSARLSLAADGFNGRSMPEGWGIMDKEGLATSDMKQRIDYQRALEGELSRTLMGIDTVKLATVHLTLPEKPIYAGAQTNAVKPTASVVLDLSRPLSPDEIETIPNLVASAVEGLTVANVTVASSDGTTLHAAGDNPAAGGSVTTSKAMKATDEYEKALSDRLTVLARQLTQRPDASVVVKADLSFDETTVETETVDPAQQVPTAEHESSEEWTGTGSPAGGTVGVDGGPLPNASDSNGTYKKADKTTTFQGGRSVTKTQQTPGGVKRMSVAVVVPYDATLGDPAFDPADVSRVVGAAAAIDTARGDTIEVATVAAGPVPTTVVPPVATTPVPGGVSTPVLGGVGGFIFLFVLVLLLLKRRKKRSAVTATGGPAALGGVPETYALPSSLSVSHSGPNPEQMKAETASIKADLDRMANETPESLAALLSSWLTKG